MTARGTLWQETAPTVRRARQVGAFTRWPSRGPVAVAHSGPVAGPPPCGRGPAGRYCTVMVAVPVAAVTPVAVARNVIG
jgi:hypothetical protein